jgi:hypothetical protein
MALEVSLGTQIFCVALCRGSFILDVKSAGCMQEPAACVSEQVTLQLVPWTCAWDDWQQEDLGQPPVVTCTPAYLQLSYEPG